MRIQKYHLKSVQDKSDFDQELLALAVNKFFESGWFSIISFREITKKLNILSLKEVEDQYTPLHCVDWSEMNPEFRNELRLRIIQYWRIDLNASNPRSKK